MQQKTRSTIPWPPEQGRREDCLARRDRINTLGDCRRCGPCSESWQEHRPGCQAGRASLSPNRGLTPAKRGDPPLAPRTQEEIHEAIRHLGRQVPSSAAIAAAPAR
eukprot:6434367-Pyramimonas_sp.AAC.1